MTEQPKLSDEAAAQIMWVKLCCVQPVGCGDGGTFVVQAPTQSEFVAVVYPGLAFVRAEATLAANAAKAAEIAALKELLRDARAYLPEWRSGLNERISAALEMSGGAK